MKRKGKNYHAWYPIPSIHPFQCDPQYWLMQYICLSSQAKGPLLFCGLAGKPTAGNPLKSNTINGVTTRYLQARGLHQWTAHSTRGAAATALLNRGVPPQVVQAMGDWESTDTFNKFYNRLRATQAHHAQTLVPCRSLCDTPQ